MYIFAIESSCDETSAAVIKANDDKIEVLSNIIASQAARTVKLYLPFPTKL